MRNGPFLVFAAALAACSGGPGTPPVPAGETGSAPAASPDFGRYSSLYSFAGKASGGAPQAGLVLHNGLLYGTTSSYGKGFGTVFSVSLSGKLRVLYAFTGFPDGSYPQAGLVWFNGAFYGTTSAGGLHGGGTVFSVSPAGSEHVVHSFGKRGDGALPLAGLVELSGGLYGTTENGGRANKGTVFEIDASGHESVLHSFDGAPTDGGHPTAALVPYKGALYGTTRAGGQLAAGGTVYKITALGQERVIHSFGVKPGDGANPAAPLAVLHGAFYGTTLHGGNASGLGTAFAVTPSGTEEVLHPFRGGADGEFPLAGLVAVNGVLYGTTMSGGRLEGGPNQCLPNTGTGGESCGTIFKINVFGDERVIYRFRGYPDGANPEAGLVAVRGILYGTTTWGGSHVEYGTVFRSWSR